MIRSTPVGDSFSTWAASSGRMATVPSETSQIFPQVGSSTRTRMTSTSLPPTCKVPARIWPGGSPGCTAPLGSAQQGNIALVLRPQNANFPGELRDIQCLSGRLLQVMSGGTVVVAGDILQKADYRAAGIFTSERIDRSCRLSF